MAGFFLPDARMQMPELLEGRKPTGPVEIDWEHPLTQQLTYFNLFNDRELRDLADPRIELLPKNPKRLIFERDGIIQDVQTGGNTTLQYKSKGMSDGYATFLFKGQYVGSSNPYFLITGNITVRYAGDRYYAIVSLVSGVYPIASAYIPEIKNEPVTIVAVLRGKESPTLIVNGQIFPGTSGSNVAPQAPAEFMKLGCAGDYGGIANYFFDVCGLFSGAMSDSEALSLNNNPYQFIIPAGT